MDDSIYPASSEKLFSAPQEQEKRFLKQKEAFKTEKPLIRAAVQHFEDRIAYYRTIDAVECDDPDKLFRQVATNKEVIKVLEEERSSLIRLIKMYDKK